jgi:hypothetical protein
MIYIGFTAIATCVFISLYGWGILCHRLAKQTIQNIAMTTTVGLGALIFSGGVLNLLHLAYGWAFDVLLLTGLALAFKYRSFRPKLQPDKDKWILIAAPGVLIALIMFFTVTTQLAPKVFNLYDDFEKYFAHPVRMLQTGTLAGSPLNALGLETLGGEAFLQGIILNHFPIQYINGADAVFGLLLCLMLVACVFPLRANFLPMCMTTILAVFFINPQYVNVSALYLGSAFMMAAMLMQGSFNKIEDHNTEEKLQSPVLTGIIYAALISLKSHFLLFPLFHLSFFVIVMAIFGRDIRRLVRWGLIAAGNTFLFLLPWILLYLPNYINLSLTPTPHRTDIIFGVEVPPPFFTTRPLFYGATPAHYTFIALAPALSAFGIALWKRKERSNNPAALVTGSAVTAAVYLLLVSLAPAISGIDTAFRYSTPFLIAGTPIILSLAYLRTFRNESPRFRLFFIIILQLLGIFIIIIFSGNLISRIRKGYEIGTILAFPVNSAFIEYNKEVIQGNAKSKIAEAQDAIPAGEPIVAWINTPFLLDYRRNVIYDAERSGISSPWASIPDVNYFIIQYKGFGFRPLSTYQHPGPGRREVHISEKCLSFIDSLKKITRDANMIYNDQEIVVLKKHQLNP